MSKKIMTIVMMLSVLLCLADFGNETDSVETSTSRSNSTEAAETMPTGVSGS